MIGVANGDTLIYNYQRQTFQQIKIPFTDNNNPNLPNFIIALTGQSNSQGITTKYDPNNPNDQPNDRIFGWNPALEKWQIADLNTESLGWNYHTFKQLGTQCSAFHFAKRLIEGYPNIRPGIINVGVSGASIVYWTNWQPSDKYYSLTMKTIENYKQSNIFPFTTAGQGYIFNVHIEQIKLALSYLPKQNQIVNVLVWDQGEADTELDFYKESLYQVINLYKTTLNNLSFYDANLFGFISVSTTGILYMDTIHKANDVLQFLNKDSVPSTKYVDCSDLQVSHINGTNILDKFHFNSESQRIIGTRLFQTYRNMFSLD